MLNFRDDPQSFSAFIKEHQDRVFNVVLNKVQHLQDAEEITQDVFIAVFRNPSAFRGESAVKTWLYRIAINKCIDYIRRQKSRNRWTFTNLISSSGKTEPTEFVHPGTQSENREQTILLYRAMKQLPDKQHTAWMLSEMENMSYREISEVMGTSVSAIESLLVRARQNLRKILGGMYIEM